MTCAHCHQRITAAQRNAAVERWRRGERVAPVCPCRREADAALKEAWAIRRRMGWSSGIFYMINPEEWGYPPGSPVLWSKP